MDCDKVNRILPQYDDGSLDNATNTEVERHLLSCPECHREYQEMKRILQSVHDELNTTVQISGQIFHDEVRRKIRQVRRSRFVYRVLSIAAVIGITISLALYGFVFRDKLISHKTITMNENLLFDDYVASQYLSPYELSEVVSNSDEDEYELLNIILALNYNTISPEDIMELFGEDELNTILQF